MSLFSHLIRLRGHAIWSRALGPDSIVVDGGAHLGEFSRGVQQRFGCRCILVEANPRLARQLQAPPGGHVIHAALAARDGLSRFVFRENPEGGSISPQLSDFGNETAEIKTLSLETACRQFSLPRVDLLKLDIEGAEFSLLEQTPDAVLTEIGQITVEFHDFLPEFKGRGLFEVVHARLNRLGFVCCPMAFRTHGDVLFLNHQKLGLSPAALSIISWFGRWVLKFRDNRGQ